MNQLINVIPGRCVTIFKNLTWYMNNISLPCFSGEKLSNEKLSKPFRHFGPLS